MPGAPSAACVTLTRQRPGDVDLATLSERYIGRRFPLTHLAVKLGGELVAVHELGAAP